VEVQILSAAPAAVYLARVLRAIIAGIVPGRHASGAIYGTLVTAGTILAASEGAQDVVEVGITVVVTLALYWIAHSYAEVLGNADAVAPSWKVATRELAIESPMVAACIIPLIVLLAADLLLGATFELAVTIGLCTTVGLLFVWGILAARRAELSRGWAVISGLVYTFLGVAIVVLKLVLLH
jgi:hypothetical protein